jgi:hypothetical protein
VSGSAAAARSVGRGTTGAPAHSTITTALRSAAQVSV